MRFLKTRKSLVVAALSTVGVVAAAATAWAMFSINSPVSASGGNGNLVVLSAKAGSVDYAGNETSLWPNVDDKGNDTVNNPGSGRHLAKVNIYVTNPNEVRVRLKSEGMTVSFTGDCGYLMGGVGLTISNSPVVIEPGAGAWIEVGSIYLRSDAPNDCIGKAFTSTWQIPTVAA